MSTAVVWLRRDLRLDDNVALYEACAHHDAVCVAFVVNPPLLQSPRIGAPLASVFFDGLRHLREDLRAMGSDLALLTGDFDPELLSLVRRIGADAVYYNEDYEPSAVARDTSVTRVLNDAGIAVHAFTDHVYFGADEIRSTSGPYKVLTPYKRRWLDMRAIAPRMPYRSRDALRSRLLPRERIGETTSVPKPADYGFDVRITHAKVSEAAALERLEIFLDDAIVRYATERDMPAIDGTSRLSMDLRAGTIGIRTCVEAALQRGGPGADVWVSELIWRDFYQMILRQFPFVAERSFQDSALDVPWNDDEAGFAAWCDGRTGYPIVDAGMRQLNATGWMHNRLRMIVASFLTKHLLIDWRRGERYFEQHLIDADLAANNGGWQWAASTGTDAVPYFRIFNPTTQGERFDPDGTFVRQWIPELGTPDYPPPIVEHKYARERAIAAFKRTIAPRQRG